MKNSILLLISFFLFFQCKSDEVTETDNSLHKETITFTSASDNLTVTGDTYIKASNDKFILLCHQAGYSRGEYIDTAPMFAEKGYNCLAIDQRSGNQINGVTNQTALLANQQGLATGYVDARPDIEAAIDKAYELNNNRPIYLLGSSYSSSWALLLAINNPKVIAAIAFSPRENLPGYNITNELSNINKPIFVTSTQSETVITTNLVSNVPNQYLTQFQSPNPGLHGARSLWDSADGHEQYWIELENFINTH